MERDLTGRLVDSHIGELSLSGERKASSGVQQWLDSWQTLGYRGAN